MPRATYPTTTVFRMTPEDQRRLDLQADRHGLSRSDMLRMLIKQALERLEREQREAGGKRRGR